MRAFQYGKLFEPSSGLRIVERKARRCLAYCRHKLGLRRIPLPVPIEEWIETALDIRFGVEDLSHLGPDVLGAAFIRDREIVVSDRVSQHDGRCRFTCAHELGHFILHAKIREVFQDNQEPGANMRRRVERHADRFAAAVLMPIPLFERELVRTLEAAQVDPAWGLSELMTPTSQSERLWFGLVVPELCRRFAVSRSAAAIRCRGLRLMSDNRRALLPMRFFEAFMGRQRIFPGESPRPEEPAN